VYPILKFGNFELHSWSVAIALSFLAGTLVAIKRARRDGVPSEQVIDLVIVIILASIIGSRLWYALFHLNRFRGNWLEIINLWHRGKFGFAGLSMMGGVSLALLAAWGFARLRKQPFRMLGDLMAPGFLLGAGIQRLFGCFLNGCCYGTPTESLFGVAFPKVLGPFLPGMHLWPAQLFDAGLEFGGFALICWLERVVRFPGSTFGMVFLYYPLARFGVDQFRYYEPAQVWGHWGPLTFNANHLFIGGLFVVAAICYLWGWRQQLSQQQAPSE
jgi:phosphatidylglycerol:prolipoprotein diacylglycerol transferase